MKKQPLLSKPFIQFLIAVLFYYLLIIIFFNKVVFQPYDLANSPDYLSGIILVDASEKLAEGGTPIWSPYYFGGMPCLAALHYPFFTYTFFNWGAVQKILTFLFINPLMEASLRMMLFHLIMAGAFTYLLARSLGLSWLVGIFSGLVYIFTPQLIALPNVGHGSKLFTASYIPLILLTIKRMLERRTLLDFTLFVLTVGMTLLSIHIQMAFYAMLAGGMFLVWSVIFDIKGKPILIPWKILLFLGGIILGLFFAAQVYFPVYEYTPYSVRGGTAGGLPWEYATQWSFHPLESLTYFIPSFFGFGGGTYWGYMPFTDMPLYWGLAALILALIGAITVRNRMATFFIILFLFAWIVSFGKFLPILYQPMFKLMPFFKSFRVPVMIQILMVISVAILAGFGLERLKDYIKKPVFAKRLLYIMIVVLGIALVVSLFYSTFQSGIGNWIRANRPEFPEQAVPQLFKMLFSSIWKSALFAVATLGVIYLFLKKHLSFDLIACTIGVILLLDLWLTNQNLVHPISHSDLEAYLEPTPAVKFLKKQSQPFRIFSADQIRPKNWYGYFGLESIDGYMGTKMKRYQDAIDSVGFASLNLINILNGKYILTDRTLPDIPIFELLLDGKQKVYLNKTAFPRAWIVHKTMTLPDVRDRLNYMRTFNPAEEAIVEEPVNIPPEAGGEAIITSYSPLKIEVKTNSPCQAFLVLSEIYYPPYWSAAIDGKKTKIYPTDHLLRGVVIPAGEHSVTFNCASVTYNLGKTVHYIVFAGILVVLIIYLLRTMKPLIRRV